MPNPGRPARVAVVGAGISGLAAAHRLRTRLGPTARIVVLEQRDRIGGVLHTAELAGVPYDMGAEAYLVRRPEVGWLLDELDLTRAQVHPTAATATVRAAGRTVPLPTGTVLGLPTSRAGLGELLSPAGLAAVRAEPDRPLRWTPDADPALGALLRARFGDELADRLADPLLGGVYAGRVDALGLRATVPAVAAALDAGAPSLTAAADATLPADPDPGPVFGALRGGYRVLLDALVGAAAAELRLGAPVRELARGPAGWRLTIGLTTAPESLAVDAVLLAVPAPAVARLLAAVAPGPAAAAAEVELASSVVVALAYRAAAAATLPPTSGVLVATGEPLTVKAVTHSTTKWAHLAPDGLVRLRASLGRYGEAAALRAEDGELVARVRADLATLAGVTAAPVAVRVQRWGGGLPQYAPGHPDRVHRIEHGLPAGIAVAGAALHGVGVPACVGTARAAADRLAGALAAARPPVSDRDGSMDPWPASTTPN